MKETGNCNGKLSHGKHAAWAAAAPVTAASQFSLKVSNGEFFDTVLLPCLATRFLGRQTDLLFFTVHSFNQEGR